MGESIRIPRNPSQRKNGGRKATIKSRAVASAIIAGKTSAEAAEAVGYSAGQNARNAFVSTLQRLAPLMDRVGLTEEYILGQLKENIRANKTELAQYQGKFTDIAEIPDNPTRIKAVESAARIRRMFPERETDDADKSAVAVQIITNVQLDKP